MGATVEIDDRGRLLAGEFNEAAKRSDIPLRLLRMIVNTRSTLTRVLLPEEPVGLGARWETRKELTTYGFKVQQVDTYTLVDRVGDEIMLNISVQQLGSPQRLEFPEEGIEISVESMSANASGQIILSLNALESDASASGSASDRISVKTVDATEDIEIDEEFEVQVANTTDMKPVEASGRRRKSKRR